MTAQDVIDRARLRLNDIEDQQYRWTNEELLLYVDEGHAKMLRERPEIHSAYETPGSATQIRAITPISALATTLDIADRHLSSLAHFVVSQALQNDNLDLANLERGAASHEIHEGELRSK